MALEMQRNTVYAEQANKGYTPGSYGFSGFKKYECYMLIKYGESGNFNISGKKQYLIELPIYPEEVSETITANWPSEKILGRSSPIAAYANTDLKNVTFSLDLHRDFLTGSFSHTRSSLSAAGGSEDRQMAGSQSQGDVGPFGTRSWYVNINKMLQMSCYPQYLDAGLIPPTTYFIFGQMILKGFVVNYSTSWKKPIINTFYAWNTVTIQMDCYPDTIITAHDFINGSGTQSTQNTYNTAFPTSSAYNSDVNTRTKNGEFSYRGNSRTASGTQILDT